MSSSALGSSWYALLQGLVSLTKPATIRESETVRGQLVDLVSDPTLAKRVISVATRPDSLILKTAPELYWAAQLTLAGSSSSVH